MGSRCREGPTRTTQSSRRMTWSSVRRSFARRRSGLLRVRGARRDDVAAPRRRGAGSLVPAADLLLQQRLRDPRAGRAGLGAGRLGGARLRAGGRWTRRHAGRDLPADRAEEAIGGTRSSTTGRPATCAMRQLFARAGQGQGLRELDRAVAGDAGRAGSVRGDGVTGPDLAMTADVNGVRRRAADGPTRSSASARCSHVRRPTQGCGRATWLDRDGRRRLPARDPRRDARTVPGAGRRRDAPDRAARGAADADRGAAEMTR